MLLPSPARSRNSISSSISPSQESLLTSIILSGIPPPAPPDLCHVLLQTATPPSAAAGWLPLCPSPKPASCWVGGAGPHLYHFRPGAWGPAAACSQMPARCLITSAAEDKGPGYSGPWSGRLHQQAEGRLPENPGGAHCTKAMPIWDAWVESLSPEGSLARNKDSEAYFLFLT